MMFGLDIEAAKAEHRPRWRFGIPNPRANATAPQVDRVTQPSNDLLAALDATDPIAAVVLDPDPDPDQTEPTISGRSGGGFNRNEPIIRPRADQTGPHQAVDLDELDASAAPVPAAVLEAEAVPLTANLERTRPPRRAQLPLQPRRRGRLNGARMFLPCFVRSGTTSRRLDPSRRFRCASKLMLQPDCRWTLVSDGRSS